MAPFADIGKALLVLGVILVVAGLFFTFGGKIPFLGKLPGDILIHRGESQCYFPLATCIVISLVLTFILNLILWILKK